MRDNSPRIRSGDGKGRAARRRKSGFGFKLRNKKSLRQGLVQNMREKHGAKHTEDHTPFTEVTKIIYVSGELVRTTVKVYEPVRQAAEEPGGQAHFTSARPFDAAWE